MTRLYLDYAATTPVRPEVLEAMLPYFSQGGGYNPSSVHREGRAARAALDDARERVAACLNAKAKEIVFTASGSEADNLAILGAARLRRPGRNRVVSAVTEHHAVLHAIDALKDEGFEASLCPVDREGAVRAADFGALIDERTALASVMHVNNELGTIQPVRDLADAAHRCGAFFHTDAIQAASYLPLGVNELGADLVSLAAHKVYGPKGVGALYVREGTPLQPLVHGGSQEAGKRAGTENVAGIAGFARALELMTAERAQAASQVQAVREAFEAYVTARIPDSRVNGAGAARAPHVCSLSFLGVDSEQLLMRLDLDGLAVSAGSACASGAVEPSHVIAALGLGPEWMRGVVRVSFGRTTTQGDARRAAEILERAVADLRSVSACF